MSTFAELYCAHTGCAPKDFRRRVFWRTLHWHAMPLAPVLLLGDYFESDQRLIDACGSATGMQQISEQIQDHRHHPHHGDWLRQQMKLRVSTQRLRRLAERFLANGKLAREPRNVVSRPIAAGKPAPATSSTFTRRFRATTVWSLPQSD
jgi:hypothetical protein